VGTPHLSLREFGRLVELIGEQRFDPAVEVYVSTSRFVAREAERRGLVQVLERAGGRLVVDTCTYWSGILDGRPGIMMTSSAKWAYYAPGNLDVRVLFASMRECVQSAVEGRVWRDEHAWSEELWA
jgi:predicted aconitase